MAMKAATEPPTLSTVSPEQSQSASLHLLSALGERVEQSFISHTWVVGCASYTPTPLHTNNRNYATSDAYGLPAETWLVKASGQVFLNDMRRAT